MEQTASESRAAGAAPDAAETLPRSEEGEVPEVETPEPPARRRSILEMIDDDAPEDGSPDESSADVATDDEPAAERPRRRSFKDPASLKGLGRSRAGEKDADPSDSPTAGESDSGAEAVAEGAGEPEAAKPPAVATADEQAGPPTAPENRVHESSPDGGDDGLAGVAGDEADPGEGSRHPVVDESAQAMVDDLVPEWIAPTETRRKKGFLARLLDGLLGWGRNTADDAWTAPSGPRESPGSGMAAPVVEAARTGEPEAGAPEIRPTDADEAGEAGAGAGETAGVAPEAGVADAVAQEPGETDAVAQEPGETDAVVPEAVVAAEVVEDGNTVAPEADEDTARARIRSLVRERDRATVAAKEDAARIYDLAASIDDFVDEILTAARRG